MATKNQYEIFKMIHQEEEARFKELTNRAKVYLSIPSILFAALTLKLNWEGVRAHIAVKLLVIGAIVSLVASVFCSVVALWVRSYEGIFDPDEVINGFGEEPPTDEDFFDDRIADLAVATNKNSKLNDNRSLWLVAASALLVAGMAIATVAMCILVVAA